MLHVDISSVDVRSVILSNTAIRLLYVMIIHARVHALSVHAMPALILTDVCISVWPIIGSARSLRRTTFDQCRTASCIFMNCNYSSSLCNMVL